MWQKTYGKSLGLFAQISVAFCRASSSRYGWCRERKTGISPPRHDMLCFGELAPLQKKRRFCVPVEVTIRVDGRMHVWPWDGSPSGLSSTGAGVVFAIHPKAFTRLWSFPTPATAFSFTVACACPGNAGPLVNEANLSLRHFHSWWTHCWVGRSLGSAGLAHLACKLHCA